MIGLASDNYDEIDTTYHRSNSQETGSLYWAGFNSYDYFSRHGRMFAENFFAILYVFLGHLKGSPSIIDVKTDTLKCFLDLDSESKTFSFFKNNLECHSMNQKLLSILISVFYLQEL